MNKLQLSLFGPFVARRGDGSVLKLSLKQRALLAALALSANGNRSRSWLQTLLWGGSGASQAGSSLRTALSQLRRELGPHAGLLSADRVEVRLDLAGVALEGDPSRGPLLEGIDIPGADEFEDWLRAERQTLGSHASHPAEAAMPVQPLPGARADGTVIVLPFGSDGFGEQEFVLGDAMAEDVARRLSRSHLLEVISHLSARELQRRARGLPDASHLDARYIVQGRVGQHDGRIRAMVDLHDLRNRRLLWSREFACRVNEPFLTGESITAEISAQVMQSILARTAQLVRARPLEHLSAHALLMASVGEMHTSNSERFARAGALLEDAQHRYPDNAALHAWRGKWHVLAVQRAISPTPDRDRRSALGNAERALDIDPDSVLGMTVRGFVHSHLMRDLDTAQESYRAALQVDPSAAFTSLLYGVLEAFRDQPESAVERTEFARRLSPLDPERYYFDSLTATAHLCNRNFEQALALAEASLDANPAHPSTLRVRVIALQMLDRGDEARSAVTALMRVEPGLTVSGYLARHPAADSASGKLFAQAMLDAGVPR